jgi:thioredoxin 1
MSTALIIIASLLLVLFLFNGYRRYKLMKNYNPESESDHLMKLTDENFSKSISKGIVLVDFWAPWCTPCKMIAPVVSELAEEFNGRIKVGKLNVDENRQAATNLGIRSIPTLILFKDGKPVERFTGVKPKSTFQKAILKQLE